jgi:hydrogenase/urease accessory protein HupE
MKKGWTILLMLLLLSPAAFAHRLNEYLEATTISLSRGKVFVELRLTPGVDVSAAILKSVDPDNDGHISQAEQLAYLARLKHDFSLTLDGHTTPLNPVSFTFATVADIKKGVGDIVIEYEAQIDQATATHQLQLKNVHYSAIGVYLVNCLMPGDAGITIDSQNRNYNQSFYQLNFRFSSGLKVNPSAKVLADRQTALKASDTRAVFKTYFFHGVNHILTGYDHLLFVSALVLAAISLWDLVKVVTAFTIAHSITLTLAVLGLVHVSEHIVEPFIAASIVFVALQNIFWPGNSRGNSRLIVAFLFGLFHGLGFASGLLEIMHQMDKTTIVIAIIGFSIGIETGNQLVLLPLFGALKITGNLQKNNSKRDLLNVMIRNIGSAGIALAGLIYFVAALIN